MRAEFTRTIRHLLFEHSLVRGLSKRGSTEIQFTILGVGGSVGWPGRFLRGKPRAVEFSASPVPRTGGVRVRFGEPTSLPDARWAPVGPSILR